MPALRVIFLWHQHQPYYKDLVTGEYRLPWVRLHGLKDYYGMVKLLDEFPDVHQNFNLVPSLITQLQDYVAGTAKDRFLDVAAKPARDLTGDERRFALQYLFQANHNHVIGRYPRYRELLQMFQNAGDSPERAEKYFLPQDFTDLQVLSQLAWFDEFFLEDPEVCKLIEKVRHYSLDDQRFVVERERELLAKILPAHAEAAQRGSIEISTSPFYHPILPLVCDTNAGAISTPGLPLPNYRFRHPEDARAQLLGGLDLHKRVFGIRPQGVWPSEGSVSEEALGIAHGLGIRWMATDEGVLGRSLGVNFSRDDFGYLSADLADKLYRVHRFDSGSTEMHMVFRDHTLSDLIGFVYSGMAPLDAAHHLMDSIRRAAQPLLARGQDALIPIILDGENAWEYYPQSGREFLRRFYDLLQRASDIESVTISEAITRDPNPAVLKSLVPGSWIHANFNVWIGAPEDNRAWDYLYHAREFYREVSPRASEAQRDLAFEELLIAEGSDWNWWYGPEHHSANDRDFDELYRTHLSNVYHALGATPPEYLAQPITLTQARPSFVPQTAYIRPHITGDVVRYFEWMGAAVYTADRRSGSMHGKQFLLDALYAGIDESNLYARLDFLEKLPEGEFEIMALMEAEESGSDLRGRMRLAVQVRNAKLSGWQLTREQGGEVVADHDRPDGVEAALLKNLQFAVPLQWLNLDLGEDLPEAHSRLRLRLSLWQNRLPVDALPVEGWIELPLLSEGMMASLFL
jgi:alpha-amylase/alpha-mannosidase (GH57 family)